LVLLLIETLYRAGGMLLISHITCIAQAVQDHTPPGQDGRF